MNVSLSKTSKTVILGALALACISLFTYNVLRNRVSLPLQLSEEPQILYSINGNGLENPLSVTTTANGHLYVADPKAHQIKLFDSNSGKPEGAFGKPGKGTGQLNYPYGLAIDQNGNLLVADPANHRISVFNTDGEFIKELVSSNNRIGIIRPGALAFDNGNIYISDLWGHQVVVLDSHGKLIRKIGSQGITTGKFQYPQSIVVDAKHRIWVADTGNNRIQVFNEAGKFLFKIGDDKLKFGMLTGMTIDNLQRVFVSDAIRSKVFVFDSKGKNLFSFGSLGSNQGQWKFPMGLWIAKDGRIFIADRGNHRIQVLGYKGR